MGDVHRKLGFDIVSKVSFYDSFIEAKDILVDMLSQAKEPVVLSFINAHAFNLCFEDSEFCSALLKSDLLVRDGKGMEILCNSLLMDPKENFCGTDFIPIVLEVFKSEKIALFGTQNPYLNQAGESLSKARYNIVKTESGFLEASEYVQAALETTPRVIVLGMGMPKQEKIALLLKKSLKYPCLIINGGAIIDHLGGKVSRAPVWTRANGLEWLYRLVTEPRRLYRRYLIGNILFLQRVYAMSGRIRWKRESLSTVFLKD